LGSLLNSGVLIPGLALGFGFYIAWIMLSAKRLVSMSLKEAEMLWKFHTKSNCCNAKTWQEITRKKKIIGYTCECGYKHIQRKPMINVN
jgi:hypothetical protein